MTANLIPPDIARRIRSEFQKRQDSIESFIKTLVELESPSGDPNRSKALVDVLVSAAEQLRCVSKVERVEVPGFGQNVVIEAFQQEQSNGQILLVGHTDTVHEVGSITLRPFRRQENRIYGPGTFDMKASCAMAIEVLRTLDELDITPRFGVTIVLTCDEEVGSQSGWPLIERVARSRNTRCALVMEPPAPGGRVKTGRKGTGMYSIRVEGIAAHAGLDPEKGASAILELARQTERLHTINNSGSGITLNVGIVRGGTRSNVVAAEAQGEIDVRFATGAESEQLEQMFKSIEPIDERVKVFISGGINRPPLERTPAVVELFETARTIGAMIDFELGEAQVGGASDGNFIAAMGIPVLDGLGVSGDGAHAMHEHILADDIAVRGTILTGLVVSL
jgi:glutamate carboxypeptidase